MAANFYSPGSVDVSLGGRVIEGFADGTMVDVEFPSDDYERKVGTKGDVGIARIYDPTATVTIRLLQTSPTNDALSALRDAGMSATSAGFASALSIRDTSGTTILQGKAWIQKRPNVTLSNTVEAREWVLGVVVSQATVGGNSQFA
jgi:hypothetical protein